MLARFAFVSASCVFAACTNSGPGPADTSSAATPTPSTAAPLIARDRTVTAEGDAAAVCNAVVRAYDEADNGWTGSPIASGPDIHADRVTWLFCEGEPASGIGLISARSDDRSRWITRDLLIRERFHAGDETRVVIPDETRAWVTSDSLAGESHTHVWTRDGGTTWQTTADG